MNDSERVTVGRRFSLQNETFMFSKDSLRRRRFQDRVVYVCKILDSVSGDHRNTTIVYFKLCYSTLTSRIYFKLLIVQLQISETQVSTDA